MTSVAEDNAATRRLRCGKFNHKGSRSRLGLLPSSSPNPSRRRGEPRQVSSHYRERSTTPGNCHGELPKQRTRPPLTMSPWTKNQCRMSPIWTTSRNASPLLYDAHAAGDTARSCGGCSGGASGADGSPSPPKVRTTRVSPGPSKRVPASSTSGHHGTQAASRFAFGSPAPRAHSFFS